MKYYEVICELHSSWCPYKPQKSHYVLLLLVIGHRMVLAVKEESISRDYYNSFDNISAILNEGMTSRGRSQSVQEWCMLAKIDFLNHFLREKKRERKPSGGSKTSPSPKVETIARKIPRSSLNADTAYLLRSAELHHRVHILVGYLSLLFAVLSSLILLQYDKEDHFVDM